MKITCDKVVIFSNRESKKQADEGSRESKDEEKEKEKEVGQGINKERVVKTLSARLS